jgi:hypothetical protein
MEGMSTIACVGTGVGLPVHPAIKMKETSRETIRCFLNIMDIVT